MSVHVMLDLETWNKTDFIVSIGAVKFDKEKILDRFHVGIDPVSCGLYGLKPEPDTVLWWLDHDRAEARAEWLRLEKVDLATALEGFRNWYLDGKGEEDVPVWGNGSMFDNAILQAAYRKIGDEAPWPFWADRCYRTIKNLFPEVKLERIGTHHSAVDDAESQARHLQRMGVEL